LFSNLGKSSVKYKRKKKEKKRLQMNPSTAHLTPIGGGGGRGKRGKRPNRLQGKADWINLFKSITEIMMTGAKIIV